MDQTNAHGFCRAEIATVEPNASLLRPQQTSDVNALNPATPSEVEDATERPGTDHEGMSNGEEAEEPAETRQPRIATRPIAPTKKEREEHLPLHITYRSWCPHCVAGKGNANKHMAAAEDADKLGMTWHMDYAFMGDEAEEGMIPTLVEFDEHTGAIWAMPVTAKGPTAEAVKWSLDKMEDSGYRSQKLTLKSDQEDSIVALKRAIATGRVAESVPIESPVRASKSNGKVENGIKVWQKQVRTIKHHVESRIKRKIKTDSPLLEWLFVWCAEIMNKFKVQASSRTVYEQITGHQCNHMVIGFAETVHFQCTQDKSHRHKLDSDWQTGVFLGVIWRTTE